MDACPLATDVSPFVVLTRRAALTSLGAAGLGAVAALTAAAAAAQDATPTGGELPPVLEEYVAAYTALDYDRLGAILAEDAVYMEIATGGVFEGREAIIAHHREFASAFSDIVVSFGSVFADGTNAAAEWIFSARYTAQLPGLPPAEGQEVSSVHGVDILELDAESVTTIREYGNLFGLLMQIGAFGEMTGEGGEATPAG
jgi:steroid delta-isomerase-like uncharacterized protein